MKAVQFRLGSFQMGAFGTPRKDFEDFGRVFKPSLLLFCLLRGNVGAGASQRANTLINGLKPQVQTGTRTKRARDECSDAGAFVGRGTGEQEVAQEPCW